VTPSSSFTLHLSVAVFSSDGHRYEKPKLIFNFDNTSINFAALVHDLSQDRLYQAATSTLQGRALSVMDALNVVGFVLTFFGLALLSRRI